MTSRWPRILFATYRSPNTPPSAEAATKPGSEKRDRIDVGCFMRSTLFQHLHRFQAALDSRNPLSDKPFMRRFSAGTPTVIREDPYLFRAGSLAWH